MSCMLCMLCCMIFFTAHLKALANKRHLQILIRSQHTSSTGCELYTYRPTTYLGSKKARRSAGLELALENTVPVATRGPQDCTIFSLFNIVSIQNLKYVCISASLRSGRIRHKERKKQREKYYLSKSYR